MFNGCGYYTMFHTEGGEPGISHPQGQLSPSSFADLCHILFHTKSIMSPTLSPWSYMKHLLVYMHVKCKQQGCQGIEYKM